jgi:hypothetical protein
MPAITSAALEMRPTEPVWLLKFDGLSGGATIEDEWYYVVF